jgi:NTE family protein
VGARRFAALLALAGCAHGPPVLDPGRRPTCLALSVGAADGVAHLGAIAAVKQIGVPISCVVGSGVGALIGAVYASAPAEDTRLRFEALVRDYAAATRSAAGSNGLGPALLFGARPPFSREGEYLLREMDEE